MLVQHTMCHTFGIRLHNNIPNTIHIILYNIYYYISSKNDESSKKTVKLFEIIYLCSIIAACTFLRERRKKMNKEKLLSCIAMLSFLPQIYRNLYCNSTPLHPPHLGPVLVQPCYGIVHISFTKAGVVCASCLIFLLYIAASTKNTV